MALLQVLAKSRPAANPSSGRDTYDLEAIAAEDRMSI